MPHDQLAHARRTDPLTSHQAAEAVTLGLPELQALVEQVAICFPDGFTDVDLITARPDLGPSTLRTRRAELVARNIVLDSMRRVRPDGHTQLHTVWIHRSFVTNPPEICEPVRPATPADKAEALAMAAKLENEARSCRAQGLAMFADFLTECAQMMRRLAV